MHRFSLIHRLNRSHQIHHFIYYQRQQLCHKFSSSSNLITTDCGLRIQTNLPRNFNKILIANRGEIACRIIRTCRQIGVQTVAIYSDADENALFVREADESYHVGAAKSSESYLNMNKIIAIAKRCNAEAIHPGYGFLSENPAFVRLCDANAIVFIGPPADAMEDMGLKSQAKQLMDDACVPTTPGYHGIGDQTLQTFKQKAALIGYPIMLKAIAGGGGKGIRPVLSEDKLEHEFTQCRNEAMSFFGNGDLLLEKYIPSARHIEFQIFTDKAGNGVHLFERDCSVQRGNQKVFEESPAPGLSAELRSKMGESAVNAALAVNYVGAGTVEFLVDPQSMDYWFMEMNTRLQVEHPVTEMIVGRDLVQWQLHVAAGYDLPCKQSDIELNGYAIEARIYAEEYNKSLARFTASSGTLHHLQFPQIRNEGGRNVRVESGVFEGGQVSTHYDAMIAKLITHCDGNNVRHDSLQLMFDCLEEFQVSGLQTNIEFLKRVLKHKAFIAGGVTTDFIPNYSEELFKESEFDVEAVQKARAFASLGYLLYANQHEVNEGLIGYIVNGGKEVVKLLNIKDDDAYYTSIKRNTNDGYVMELSRDDKDQSVVYAKSASLSKDNKHLYIQLSDEYIDCDISFYENKVTIFYKGRRFDYRHSADIQLLHPPEFVKGKGGIVIAPEMDEDSPIIMHKSPMQAKVFEINVNIGDNVSKEQLMGSVESMKQLYEIWAQCDGVVTDIVVSNEESVEEGQNLIKVTRAEAKQIQKENRKRKLNK